MSWKSNLDVILFFQSQTFAKLFTEQYLQIDRYFFEIP